MFPLRSNMYVPSFEKTRESRSSSSKLSRFLLADPVSLIHDIHRRGMRAGIAISPDTPSTVITDEIGVATDMLLVMTVYPGASSPRSLSGPS